MAKDDGVVLPCSSCAHPRHLRGGQSDTGNELLSQLTLPYGNTGARKPKARYFINAPGFVLGISDIPDVKIRIPVKFDSPEVIKDKKQYPIKLNERVIYYLRDRKDCKFYQITAYKGERFDCFMGAKYLPAFILHKKICDDLSLIDCKKYLHRDLLYELLLLTGVTKFLAAIIAAFLCGFTFTAKEKK